MSKVYLLAASLIHLMIICLAVSSAGGQEKKESQSVPPPPPTTKTQPKPKHIFSPFLSVKHVEAEIAFQRALFAQHVDVRAVAENGMHREMWGYKDAYLFWLRQRSFPNDTIDWGAYVRAFAQQALMFKAKIRPAPASPGSPPVPPPRWEV